MEAGREYGNLAIRGDGGASVEYDGTVHCGDGDSDSDGGDHSNDEFRHGA